MYHEDQIHFILPLSKQDSFYVFDEDEDEADDEDSTEEGSLSGSERSGSERSYPSQTAQSSRKDSIDEVAATTETTTETTTESASRKNSTSSSFEELSATEAGNTNE